MVISARCPWMNVTTGPVFVGIAVASVVPGLVAVEAILVVLRLTRVLAWRWWIMAPVGVAVAAILSWPIAAVLAVAATRDLLRVWTHHAGAGWPGVIHGTSGRGGRIDFG
jgi:hypothetical protein